MVESVGRIYREKVENGKRVLRYVGKEKVELYLVAEKSKLKELEEMTCVVMVLEESGLSMGYYLWGGYVYYFTLATNYYLVEKEEVGKEDLEELVHRYFRGYTPERIEEDLGELKRRYGDWRRKFVLAGAFGGVVLLLGFLLKLAFEGEEAPPPLPLPTQQVQSKVPLSEEEVYKAGVLALRDAGKEIERILRSVKEGKLGEVVFEDVPVEKESERKEFKLRWSTLYPYPAPETTLEEGGWKREEEKVWSYGRGDVASVVPVATYECFEKILKRRGLRVLVRTRGVDEMEMREVRPSEVVQFLRDVRDLGCPVYLKELKLSGSGSYVRFKVREG